jgi:hypothetical protein
MESERLENYLYSEADLLSLENGGLGGFPYADPGKSRHANKGKIRYVGKDWINNPQKRERVEGILRETSKKAKVKTSSSWIRDKISPYVEKVVYYLNKLFAIEKGYIADYGTVEIEEMKEDPYIRDRKGRIIGEIRGVYKRPTDDIGLNSELKKKEAAEGLDVTIHELDHKGEEYLGENGEYEEAFGPLAVPAIEAKTRLTTDIVRRQLYHDDIIGRYLRMPRDRLPTA